MLRSWRRSRRLEMFGRGMLVVGEINFESFESFG